VAAVLRASLPLAVNGALALVALRVELLVVFWARGSWEAGLFGAAVKIVEALNGVPSAIAAGAMPALTREALPLGGERVPHADVVRRRTVAVTALLAVPAAAGLALLAPGVLRLLGGDYVAAAPALRVLAFAVVALFTNVVLLHSLIAAGRAGWLPRLTAVRVAFAALVAAIAIPRWGVVAAASGVLAAELLLTALSARACRLAGFAVPLSAPLLVAVSATAPMAAAVALIDAATVLEAAAGAGVYAATLAVAWALAREPLQRALGAGEPA
jgi:O-antigen/teichoic acid export membrane protein